MAALGRARGALIGLAIAALAGGVALAADDISGDRDRVPPPRPVANDAFLSSARPDAPAVVWAVGDGADGSASARAVARRIAADRPDRLLYLGDVYESGSAEDFRERYEPVYGALAAITAPTPGNHDWPLHRDGYDPYWRAKTGAPTPPWYAFRTGGWRIISLNSEAPHGRRSPQLRWLRAELRRGGGTCTLAFWHRPRHSAGDHGDQVDVAPLWDALRGRARLVLAGHDHDMQRLRPRDGITALVAGAGGRSRYGVDGSDPRLAFGDDAHDGALRLELRPGRARLAFVAAGGAVLDRSAVTCATGGR
jgi:acid phosphatase type 7